MIDASPSTLPTDERGSDHIAEPDVDRVDGSREGEVWWDDLPEPPRGTPLDLPPDGPDRGISWRTVGFVVAVVVLVAVVSRVVWLADRPLHHDESLDAWFSWHVRNGTYDGYDPVYHGPLRFYITAVLFILFGESVTIARLTAALAGATVVAMVWVWRRHLDPVGTICAAVLIAVSPSMLYFSRVGREDSLFLALTLASVLVLVAFLERPRPWHPLALLTLVVCAMAVKESVFLNVFIFGSFGMVLLTQELLLAGSASALLGGAARPAARTVRRSDDPGTDPSVVDAPGPFVVGGDDRALVWNGDAVRRATLAFGLAAMIVAFLFGEPIFVSLGAYGAVLGTMLVLAAVSAARRRIDWRQVGVLRSVASVPFAWWVIAAVGASFVFVMLFTQFLTDFSGNVSEQAPYGSIRNGLVAGFEYWRGEQDTIRGDARWQYYLAVIPAYEWFGLALAALGIAHVFRRPTLVGQLLVWWGVASFTVHSWAGERMPWLVIHPLLPFLLLGGLGGASLWRRRTLVVAPLVAALGAILFGFWLWTAAQAAYVRGGEPVELFVQAGQATEQVPAWADRLVRLDRLVFAEEGRHLQVAIDSEVYWPYGWYLRDFPAGTYADVQVDGDAPTSDVVFLPHWKLDEIRPKLVGYVELPYAHRWWWVPDFAVGPRSWLHWVWDRTVWTGTTDDPSDAPGQVDGSVFVRQELLALESAYDGG